MGRCLGIIPARGGSKRVPGKNKRPLNGKELVRYAIETALGSREVTDWVLSTDDADIVAIGNEYQGLKVIERPAELAGDKSPAIDYVRHALAESGEKFSATVIFQPTSPFTAEEDVDATVKLLFASGADSAVSVMEVDHVVHPVKLKTMQGSELLPYLEKENGRMAAHELPQVYVRNGSVYVSTLATIASGRIIGDNCVGHLMPRERSIDINDSLDFAFAEYLMQRST